MDYVTADLHFNHRGLLRFRERQQFKTIQDHDEYVIRRLNTALKPSDTLYILGDVGFREGGSLESLASKIRRIECAKKILIMGNHDKFSVTEAQTKLGFDEVHKGPFYYENTDQKGRILLSHEPAYEAFHNPYVINVHGHVHNYRLKLEEENFYNVNIGMTSFSPISMRHFEKIAQRKCKSRQERFASEWYYRFYIFEEGDKNEESDQNCLSR